MQALQYRYYTVLCLEINNNKTQSKLFPFLRRVADRPGSWIAVVGIASCHMAGSAGYYNCGLGTIVTALYERELGLLSLSLSSLGRGRRAGKVF